MLYAVIISTPNMHTVTMTTHIYSIRCRRASPLTGSLLSKNQETERETKDRIQERRGRKGE